jgi:hypothetical protein
MSVPIRGSMLSAVGWLDAGHRKRYAIRLYFLASFPHCRCRKPNGFPPHYDLGRHCGSEHE